MINADKIVIEKLTIDKVKIIDIAIIKFIRKTKLELITLMVSSK